MRRTPKDTAASFRKISRRGMILGGLQVGFAGLLALRMRHLQVDQADEFRLLAEENRINLRLLPPSRGQIFDRNGRVIAANEPSYRITLVREDAGDVDAVIARLSMLVELDEDELNRALTEMKRSAPFLPVTIADRVGWDAISRVAVNAPALPGVTPEVGLSRIYPNADIYAHIAGYVGPVSERDLNRYEDPDPVLRIPRFQIGKVGVEAKYEDMLRGRAGAKRVEVNAVGRVMRELDRREGEAGSDLQLTIDTDLQDYVQARLGEESASVVVMDVETGDVLACASAPTYDPNKFVRGISVADYAVYRDNEKRPLASKTVQDAYPPGSTFKMITALAALEAGVVTPSETVYCPGHLEVGGRKFHCWKRAGHGHMNLEQSLRESCDVYYYDLALKVGIEKIAEMARRLGLGEVHDLPMSAVTKGLVPDKNWKFVNRGADWVVGEEGDGWRMAVALLAHERSSIGSGGGRQPIPTDRIIDLARSAGRTADPLVRQDLARLVTGTRIIQWLNLRQGIHPSIPKLWRSAQGRLASQVTSGLAFPGGAAWLGDPMGTTEPGDFTSADGSHWSYGICDSRAHSLGGGTDEIQRNTLGERVLGLPREPAPDRGLPFSQVPKNA